jgi:hypothetical protein
MTAGAIGIAFGVPGPYYLLEGSASGDDYTGLVAIVAGVGAVAERAGHAVEGPAPRRKPPTTVRTAGARRRHRCRGAGVCSGDVRTYGDDFPLIERSIS